MAAAWRENTREHAEQLNQRQREAAAKAPPSPISPPCNPPHPATHPPTLCLVLGLGGSKGQVRMASFTSCNSLGICRRAGGGQQQGRRCRMAAVRCERQVMGGRRNAEGVLGKKFARSPNPHSITPHPPAGGSCPCQHNHHHLNRTSSTLASAQQPPKHKITTQPCPPAGGSCPCPARSH
jgi:hypothetical protein